MTVLRYLTPPIFGATASLGLLYLYQQSLVTTHSNLRDSIVSGSQAVKRIEDRHQGLIEDKVRETREQMEGQVRGGRSRYSQGGESISDEIRRKWNVSDRSGNLRPQPEGLLEDSDTESHHRMLTLLSIFDSPSPSF